MEISRFLSSEAVPSLGYYRSPVVSGVGSGTATCAGCLCGTAGLGSGCYPGRGLDDGTGVCSSVVRDADMRSIKILRY